MTVATLQVSLPDGQQISVSYPASPLMDMVVREVLTGSEYPRLKFPTAGTAVVDIGANVGCSAIVFALQYPGATVYALEPAQTAFEFLAQNTASFSNIQVYQLGGFDKDATARLFHGRAGSVTNSLFAGGLASDTDGETIQLRRISGFLREQGIGRISVLKIDTEGAELAILRDLAGHFPQIDAIHVEFHSEADRLDIDRLLLPDFALCFGKITEPHRGILTYVARRLDGQGIDMKSLEIKTRASVG